MNGWVRTRRDSKGFSFLELNDGSCLKNLQVIVDEALPAFSQLKDVATGAAVEIEGTLVESPGAGQKWEVKASRVRLLGAADPESYPLAEEAAHRRVPAHHRPPPPAHQHIRRRLPHPLASAPSPSTGFSGSAGFSMCTRRSSPASDCEGAGEMFRVTTLPLCPPAPSDGEVDRTADFFGKEASLTVSGQLEGGDSSPARWATSTPSARPSAPRTPTRRATPPSSG